jgi:hypothetical protein
MVQAFVLIQAGVGMASRVGQAVRPSSMTSSARPLSRQTVDTRVQAELPSGAR